MRWLPRASRMKSGSPPTLLKARTGLFTPPGISSTARRYSSRERSMVITSSVPEPEPDLLRGGLGGVGAVDQVFLDIQAIIGAQGAGRRLERPGGAHDLPDGRDRAVSFQDHRDDRAGGDELHDALEERLAAVHAIVILRQRPRRPDQSQLGDRESPRLEAADNLAHQPAPDSVRFHHHKSSLHSTLLRKVDRRQPSCRAIIPWRGAPLAAATGCG